MAVQRQRPAPGLICHTDRGGQLACEPDRKALADAGITPRVGRNGACLDNAPMERFFPSPKVERAHHRVQATRAEARRDLFAGIEGRSQPPPPPLRAGTPLTGRRGTHDGMTAPAEPAQDHDRAGGNSYRGSSPLQGIGRATMGQPGARAPSL